MGLTMRLVREPVVYPAGYLAQHRDQPSCYHFANGSISVCLAVMQAADVIDDQTEAPRFPCWPPPGASDRQVRLIEKYLDDAELRRTRLSAQELTLVQTFERQLEQAVTTPAKRPGKVPEFKFKSNDGWLISPAECRAVAAGLARLLREGHPPLFQWLTLKGYSAEDARAFIRQWRNFNQLAADCGGYRVS
jgi:hypothetical protein